MSILQHSIVDKEKQICFDDDEDDVLLLASQSAEEQDRLNRHNVSYGGFALHVPTSTQYPSISAQSHNAEVKTGCTEKIKNVIDLTTERDSQKENFGSSNSIILKQQQQIKDLYVKLNETSLKLQQSSDKILEKDGETKNLRRSNKMLENQLKKMKIEKLEAANTSKIDPEKEALRREVEALKAQKEFDQINTFPRLNSSISEAKAAKILSTVQFHTNTSIIPAVLPQMSTTMFEPEEIRPSAFEPRKAAINREMTNFVVTIQLKLAENYARIVSGHNFSDEAVDDVFTDAADMIFYIGDFIEYLETDETSPFAIDNNPALTAAVMLSLTIRPKLTKIDRVRNGLTKNAGRLSIFQAKKMFPEEICSKPRRIIAFYAALAKNSQKFSEKLLTDNIAEENNHQTFISVLIDILLNHVSQSEDFYDYCGFTIAVGSLLSSLGSHYGKYTNNGIIDIALEQLLHAVLLCRCDNALLMVEVTKFMADISSHPEKTEVISKLCVNYPISEIREISRTYRHFEFPSDACVLYLLFSYLLTSFKFSLNVFEMELLMETLLNLNRLSSNIMEFPINTVKFVSQSLLAISEISCGCLQQLTNATVSLNCLLMAHRNIKLTQLTPLDSVSSVSSRLIDSMKFQKSTNLTKYFHSFLTNFFLRSQLLQRTRKARCNFNPRSLQHPRAIYRLSLKQSCVFQPTRAVLELPQARNGS